MMNPNKKIKIFKKEFKVYEIYFILIHIIFMAVVLGGLLYIFLWYKSFR